jgi:hypothetical protein
MDLKLNLRSVSAKSLDKVKRTNYVSSLVESLFIMLLRRRRNCRKVLKLGLLICLRLSPLIQRLWGILKLVVELLLS